MAEDPDIGSTAEGSYTRLTTVGSDTGSMADGSDTGSTVAGLDTDSTIVSWDIGSPAGVVGDTRFCLGAVGNSNASSTDIGVFSGGNVEERSGRVCVTAFGVISSTFVRI
jgi:hypothetical protein